MTAFDRAWALLKNVGQCDDCGEEAIVAELRLSEPGAYGPNSGYSALDLCRSCWENQMEWRRLKNEEFEYQMQSDVKPEIPDELHDHGPVADLIESVAPFFKPTKESLFPILPFPHMEAHE